MKSQDFITNEETITEWSDIHRGIKKELKAKGYKLLGSGVDQMAFLEPSTGYVLKVFGTQEELAGKPNKFSEDHKMFFKWAKYCMKNSSNPFLPKFFGYESFVYDNSNYLQIRQERLRDSGDIGNIVEELGGYIYGYHYEPENMMRLALATLKNRQLDDADEDQESPAIITCIEQFGKKDTMLLLKTLEKLAIMCRENGWSWDLHNSNVMRRGKIPVLVDPWIAG